MTNIFRIAIWMCQYIFTLEVIVTLVTVTTVVCTCALQRILDHTLGARELTKMHQNNAFSPMLNEYTLKFTNEIASLTIALEMDFFKEEIFFICLIYIICFF